MSPYSALWLFIYTSSIQTILSIDKDDIPSRYISTKPMNSLFCNTCAVLSGVVNETLYDTSSDFESLVGFRLDSTGKKIRKQSAWLKLFLALEDVCDDWKDKYRTAKRKNGHLYLIESEMVRAFERIERKRKEKLEKEAADRLNKQWDEEWQEEKAEKDRIYNLTHDAFGNEIAQNDANQDTEQEDKQEEDTKDGEQNEDMVEDDEDDDDADDKESKPRYFHEKKPKLVKRKSKQHKITGEMCHFLNEKLDEWLHEQQQVIPKQMKEGDALQDHLKPFLFCMEGKVCKAAMFEIKPKIFKFKKELKLPKKPKRTWRPPINVAEEDYEEQMEDDVDEDKDDKDVDVVENQGANEESDDKEESKSEL